MQAYPFLWGKSAKFEGWKLIAEPKFLQQLDGVARSVVTKAQEGIELAADEVRLVRYTDPQYGVLDLAYRKVPSPYKEEGGRPFDFIEGMVLRNRDDSVKFSHSHFDEARAAVQPQYDLFAQIDDPTHWGKALSNHDQVVEINTRPEEPPLKVLEVFCKEPVSSEDATAVLIRESIATKVNAWSQRVSRTWEMPAVRAAVIFGAVASVAIGAYALVRHLQHKENRQMGVSRG